METYSYSLDNEYFVGEYYTREDAFAVGKDELAYDLTPEDVAYYDTFYVYTAKNKPFNPPVDWEDADNIISKMIECADEECDAGYWLNDVTKEQKIDLARMLNDAFSEWLIKYDNEPTFFIPEEVQEHVVKRGDVWLDVYE